ncbi:MAG: undecaprenyldiphospho-muramoylpentapeptide beta-N-acetylglucosaminyltransferase [Planctomycetota bacterium]|nr:MAG: undecaprenyldiphospho-muramoylpentapeptide beta-N-acetylglucosaminyltransferase [Planctomycetota bacterium]
MPFAAESTSSDATCRRSARRTAVHLRVVFAGGGTGGHVFPGLALAEWLADSGHRTESYFVGTNREIERRIVDGAECVHRHFALEAIEWLSGVRFSRSAHAAFGLVRSTLAADRLLRQLQPAVVVGLGGAASVPTVLAARRRRIPVVLLEQNVKAGRANRFLARWADAACVGFAPAADDLKRARTVHVTGNPVRQSIAALAANSDSQSQRRPTERYARQSPDRAACLVTEPHETPSDHARRTRLEALPEPPRASALRTVDDRTPVDGHATMATATPNRCLLVVGGSQGSRHLNDAAIAFAERCLPPEWWIWHQTGRDDEDRVRNTYRRLGISARVDAFIEDMTDAWRVADVLIARAGALTISECCCAGCAAVLVPLPSATDGHQAANARLLESENAAIHVKQAATAAGTAEELRRRALPLLRQEPLRQCLSRNARRLARPRAAACAGEVILELATARAGDACPK